MSDKENLDPDVESLDTLKACLELKSAIGAVHSDLSDFTKEKSDRDLAKHITSQIMSLKKMTAELCKAHRCDAKMITKLKTKASRVKTEKLTYDEVEAVDEDLLIACMSDEPCDSIPELPKKKQPKVARSPTAQRKPRAKKVVSTSE